MVRETGGAGADRMGDGGRRSVSGIPVEPNSNSGSVSVSVYLGELIAWCTISGTAFRRAVVSRASLDSMVAMSTGTDTDSAGAGSAGASASAI
jgi:hypothetical protein